MHVHENKMPFSEDSERKKLALKLGLKIVDSLSTSQISKELIEKIPYSFVKKYRVLPLSEDKDFLLVAVGDPLNLDPLEDLRLMFDKEVRAIYCCENDIQQMIDALFHQKSQTSDVLADLSEEAKKNKGTSEEIAETYDLLEDKDEAPLIRLLNLILSEAITQEASDIHFEPYEDRFKVRYRIDGVLVTRHTPEKEYQKQLLTRLKVMAKLDIAEHRLPQDGRMKLKLGGRDIDFRVSTLPTTYGERIVLRILDRGNIQLGLDKLGMLPKTLDLFRKLIASPEGMILVTGPTGSGKTTTLYSALWEIYSEEINIMTIEDPVEYKLKGIAQMGVHPKIGLTFASGLRHILRQDPDVVMIGEIRDTETAEIAIQAALTGHLVFATLHTNDAPSSVLRLIDMGIEPYLLSSTLIGVIAQRLVRTICPNCRQVYSPSKDELTNFHFNKKTLPNGKIYHGRGCSHCFGSGYKGRHGIYEFMPITPSIQKLIVQRADSNELKEESLNQGMTTLTDHGEVLIRGGMTTLKEVLRITRNL